MTDEDVNKFRGVVKEEINSAVEPVVKKLDILWDQVMEVTADLSGVKETLEFHTETLESHGASLKRIEEGNWEDIKKLDKRLTTVENQEGIIAPPELTIAR